MPPEWLVVSGAGKSLAGVLPRSGKKVGARSAATFPEDRHSICVAAFGNFGGLRSRIRKNQNNPYFFLRILLILPDSCRRLAQQIPAPSVRSENADRLAVVSRARRPQVFGRGQHAQAGLPNR
jgi:hypothetical protein